MIYDYFFITFLPKLTTSRIKYYSKAINANKTFYRLNKIPKQVYIPKAKCKSHFIKTTVIYYFPFFSHLLIFC